MTDYPKLYQRLAQEIITRDGDIAESANDFVIGLVKKLWTQGWRIDEEAQKQLADYMTGMQTMVKTGITSAAGLAVATLPKIAQSDTVKQLVAQAFDQRWPDGLKLSDRLWRWDQEMRTGLSQTLQANIRQGTSVNAVMMNMQRTIEQHSGGQLFKIVETYQEDWVKELHQSAMAVIHDPSAKLLWNDTVAEVEEHIASLSSAGTKHAAQRVLSQIQAAVGKGSEELADKAVKWWLYDKQLYHIKRIARTEMATVFHQAVITGSQDDETIIGYQWRLSSSHSRACYCNYYADIDMGLGRGVFTKDAVPWNKPHPHCMCLLVPRVTPIKASGAKSYGDFIKSVPSAQLHQLLPDWAIKAMKAGTPVSDLLKPNGLGLITQAQFKQ